MTTTSPVGGTSGYLDDRYDRFRNGCEILASDPAIAEADSIFGADGLRALTNTLIDARILDGLSAYDAGTVAMLVQLNFTRGPLRIAWRLTDWLKPDGNSVGRVDDNTDAVVAALALALGLVMSAFAGSEFEQASPIANLFRGGQPA